MASTSIEVERKYEAPDGFALPDLSGIPGVSSVGAADEFDLDATYYDTDDLTLARHRVTLRRRQGGHDAGWHLKRPAEGGRSETHAPDADRLPDDLAAQIRVLARERDLRPVVRLRTTRRETPLRDAEGRVLALIAEDLVDAARIGAGRQVWSELEVELVAGANGLLDDVEAALVEAGAKRSDLPSKLSRALGDAGRPVADEPVGGSAAGRTLMAYVRAQRSAILDNDRLVRVADPDGVHDMRVAIRRLRSTLSTFRPMLTAPDPASDDEPDAPGDLDIEPLRAELHWLAGLLGAVRDGDVLADELIQDISATASDMVPSLVTQRIRRRLGEDAEQARRELAEAMNSTRYFALLDTLDAVADRPAPEVTDKALRKRVRRRLAKADRALRVALGADHVSPDGERDHELHEARKAYKKARYAVEAIAPDHGDAAGRLIDRIKALQDVLGEHQDAVVAATLLRRLGQEAHEAGESDFGYGMLCEQQIERAVERRAETPAAFHRVTRPKVRDWLGS